MPGEYTLRSVTVTIVYWNTRDHLARCLKPLQEHTPELDTEIIPVDNASSDGSTSASRVAMGLSASLIPERGAPGAASGTAVGLMILNIASAVLVYRHLRVLLLPVPVPVGR